MEIDETLGIDYPCSDTYREAIFMIKASGVDYPASPEFVNWSFNRKLAKKLARLMIDDPSEIDNSDRSEEDYEILETFR